MRRIVCVCSFNFRNESRKWIFVSALLSAFRLTQCVCVRERARDWKRQKTRTYTLDQCEKVQVISPNVWRRKINFGWSSAGTAQCRLRNEKPPEMHSVKHSYRKMKNKLFDAVGECVCRRLSAASVPRCCKQISQSANGKKCGREISFAFAFLGPNKAKIYSINGKCFSLDETQFGWKTVAWPENVLPDLVRSLRLSRCSSAHSHCLIKQLTPVPFVSHSSQIILRLVGCFEPRDNDIARHCWNRCDA